MGQGQSKAFRAKGSLASGSSYFDGEDGLNVILGTVGLVSSVVIAERDRSEEEAGEG